jgi:hypothetical protein
MNPPAASDIFYTCLLEAYRDSRIEPARSLSFDPDDMSFSLRWRVSAAVVLDSAVTDEEFMNKFREWNEKMILSYGDLSRFVIATVRV